MPNVQDFPLLMNLTFTTVNISLDYLILTFTTINISMHFFNIYIYRNSMEYIIYSYNASSLSSSSKQKGFIWKHYFAFTCYVVIIGNDSVGAVGDGDCL